ncbi:MAG: hypothetical protein KKB21_04110 [Nanoarchaeota archaeon]|nr:hypothetical protein [Nanoarchaeota archaeon]MBU4086731.1 hypothetical protein [Nanoarchaeota archaeon]
MRVEDHLRNIQESLEVINESIQKGIQERQRNIGFNCSVASVEMLEIFLHKNNLINPGAVIKHDWFASERKANEKLPFDFPEKDKIMKIPIEIESKRSLLCYGKPHEIETIESVISSFNQIKSLFESLELKWN